MVQISFFFSLDMSPFTFSLLSLSNEAGAMSMSSVSAMHFSSSLFDLARAEISARDAVSSRAESSLLIRSGWFCSPQWLVIAPVLLSLRLASFLVAPEPPASLRMVWIERSVMVGARMPTWSSVMSTARDGEGRLSPPWRARKATMCSKRASPVRPGGLSWKVARPWVTGNCAASAAATSGATLPPGSSAGMPRFKWSGSSLAAETHKRSFCMSA
mmetsp:Transcript_62037/g.121834  ORF Transcript_62037/g.121834 Transcript_62037/m.121834 type:complete len:215 (+) Transcript_62037:185-829(+)